jgi:hypothetical protein
MRNKIDDVLCEIAKAAKIIEEKKILRGMSSINIL